MKPLMAVLKICAAHIWDWDSLNVGSIVEVVMKSPQLNKVSCEMLPSCTIIFNGRAQIHFLVWSDYVGNDSCLRTFKLSQ